MLPSSEYRPRSPLTYALAGGEVMRGSGGVRSMMTSSSETDRFSARSSAWTRRRIGPSGTLSSGAFSSPVPARVSAIAVKGAPAVDTSSVAWVSSGSVARETTPPAPVVTGPRGRV